RLHYQASEKGTTASCGRESCREAVSLARKSRTPAAVEPERRPSHRLCQRRDEKYRANGRTGRSKYGNCAHHWGKRNGEGSYRRCNPRCLTSSAQASNQSQLRGTSGYAARIGIVRV